MAGSAASAPTRVGMPAGSSILSTRDLTPRRPAQAEVGLARGVPAHYRILRTDEVDAKDHPLSTAEIKNVMSTGGAAATRTSGDTFAGTARAAAKLSISGAAIEPFNDIKDLIDPLPSKNKMVHHHPPITTEAASARVQEEERNVRVTAFLYAASRENDNDFHLIVGRDPSADPPMYMTMEVSGLPPSNASSFARLKAAREAYTGFFGNDLPGASYDFYDPPIPIRVEGSLFFDMSHANGRSPGPPSLHDDMPVIWEVHPISDIVFEP
jgi:hypothetical protein